MGHVLGGAFGEACPARRGQGLETLYREALSEVSSDLARRVERSEGPGKLRAFAGHHGYFRQATGPGWALAGDAGFFRDPITAHGITDALRESEFLARAILEGDDDALVAYRAQRDERVAEFFDITDQIASFEWDMEEVKDQHLVLAREMNALVDTTRTLDLESSVSVLVSS